MKKKFISLSLVFIFSFTLISSARQKETQAVATTIIAGYTISQILGAMALSATVVGAGYAVTDTLVNPDDNSKFTDFLQTVFKQTLDLHKYEVPPPPEPLGALESATLLGLLTEQGIEVGKDLYEKVYKYFLSEEPYPVRSILNGKRYIGTVNNGLETYYILDNQYTKFYEADGYIQSNGWVLKRSGNETIGFDSIWVEKETNLTEIGNFLGNVVIYDGIYSSNISTLSNVSLNLKVEKEPEPDFIKEPFEMVKPDIFQNVFKNVDMSPLNGLVKNPQELIDIVNGVKKVPQYVYGKITSAFNNIYENFLKNPNFIGADTPLTPTIEPSTGLLYYGDPLPDEPEIDNPQIPDNELSFWGKVLYWLKAIWQGIRDLPGLISNAFRGLFDLVTIPLNSLVGFIQDIWEWLQGVPEMIYDFFVPPSTDIAEVWDPVILLWHDKLEPVKAPLDNLLFHEIELQDISADLEFNGIGGNYKIIDYQYVKSVKDQVKGIIRAFFWILIIFFNVDQVHRLIRNQGIIKSYVRKMDEPGGKS